MFLPSLCDSLTLFWVLGSLLKEPDLVYSVLGLSSQESEPSYVNTDNADKVEVT